jgi:hypothetical protein
MMRVRTCRLPTVERLLADEARGQLKPCFSRLYAKAGPQYPKQGKLPVW